VSDILVFLSEQLRWILAAIAIWSLLTVLILIHEIGHALAGKMLGVPATQITVGLPAIFTVKIKGLPISFGLIPLIGSARIDDTGKHWLIKLTVAIAGPAISFATACISYAVAGSEYILEAFRNGFWIWGIVKAFWYDTDFPIPDAASVEISLSMTAILMFANINLVLAVLNMLPVPILDGGRVLFALIEGVTGKWLVKYQPALIGISFWILMVWMILR
jgi:membrane-associated protease RseP (regulator of RpoE activity)